MSAKKRFFKKTEKALGNKSVNIRGKQTPKKAMIQSVQKKLEKRQENVLLPSISQTIAEKQNKISSLFKGKPVSFWLVMVGIFFVILTSLAGGGLLGREILQTTQIVSGRMALQREMMLWEDISKKYPTYRDANFQVAILAYRLGNVIKEREYAEKTLTIDPNFEPAKRLLE